MLLFLSITNIALASDYEKLEDFMDDRRELNFGISHFGGHIAVKRKNNCFIITHTGLSLEYWNEITICKNKPTKCFSKYLFGGYSGGAYYGEKSCEGKIPSSILHFINQRNEFRKKQKL